MTKRICGTCGHASKFDYPPSPGEPDEGVHCQSRGLAEDCDLLDEYEEKGSALVLRVEVVDGDQGDCPYWIPKE